MATTTTTTTEEGWTCVGWRNTTSGDYYLDAEYKFIPRGGGLTTYTDVCSWKMTEGMLGIEGGWRLVVEQ